MSDVLQKAKNRIRQELEVTIKAILFEGADGQISGEVNQAVCNTIEAIFIHGLKDAFFLKGSRYSKYPEPNFWPFVSKFTHKSVKNQINGQNQIKNEIGKGRAWIRIIMNEGALEHYISMISKDTQQLQQFYGEAAFLRDSDKVETFIGYLKALSKVKLNVPTNSTFLNTWTPTPLVLAGLMHEKSVKVSSLITSKKEIDGGHTSFSLLSKTSVKGSRTSLQSKEDDERSSVYSHPSLVDGQMEAATTSDLSSEVVVRRSKGRRRGLSQSSSESHSLYSLSNASSTQKLAHDTFDSVATNKPKTSKDACETSVGQRDNNNTVTCSDDVTSSNQEESVNEATINDSEVKKDRSSASDQFNKGKIRGEISDLGNEGHNSTNKHTNIEVTVDLQDSPEVKEGIEVTKVLGRSEELVGSSFIVNTSFTDDSANDEKSLKLEANEDKLEPEEELVPSNCGNSLLGKGWDGMSGPSGLSSNASSLTSSEPLIPFGEAMKDVVNNQITPDSRSGTEEPSELFEKEEPVIIEAENLPDLNEANEMVKEKELYIILTTIPIEKGLDSQGFRCPNCRRSIGASFGNFKLCHFDGLHYCDHCFKKFVECPIPARILFNWDHRSRVVTRTAYNTIQSVYEKPLFKIDAVNKFLYNEADDLDKIRRLREKLSLVSMYLLSCKQSVAEDLKRRLWPNDYLYTDIHMYSLKDLENVPTGVLERRLNTVINFAVEHVASCVLCIQKGFICEICNSRKVVYSFQTDVTYRCKKCFSVYHKTCMEGKECPRCLRQRRNELRLKQMESF
ncbi:unnamed protein product [Bursaphelenchus okinawaensis]|uniref:RUN domain-containing protein n=1 Tax=Bursaphelenchus okinawaensis TaxID=465554 RepID=A0A811K4V1_9BILA|nr:unnamed protein product [Bursaphelenchus okinawaensis]CAG9092533.1 unnamed protein product [Bursaphelenchus okinawaensis]